MSEWITDRLPTEEDATEGMVLYTNPHGIPMLRDYEYMKIGEPWMPLPAPYVKPKRWTVEWNVDTWVLVDDHLERSYWCGLGELGRNGGNAAQRIADLFNEVMP